MKSTRLLNNRLLYVLLAIFSFPLFGHASAYWMEIKGSEKKNEPVIIQVIYGNVDEYGVRHRQSGTEHALIGDFKVFVIDAKGKRTDIVITPKADCWEGIFVPDKDGVYRILGINDKHPVVDRSKSGGDNILPIDYLAASYNVGDVANKKFELPMQFLDISVYSIDKLVNVKAFQNGVPAANKTKLRVLNPENWERELSVDKKGEAFFMSTMKGLYIIREDWVDSTPGIYKGVPYKSIRYRCNYCLQMK
ncbi:hypothetical protein OIU83_13470 [Flavobacterium sp. LS1R49]|uniref:Uncharacterized protein n=1 Tax=Flavobacterium shii TaxID=2987687 RepID=A0A9X2ZJD0_9FLAO|nr:hypothetical protein [Flavobacterium shii]MCV9928673.1 hypothetical protein [Flavobacterium shii]